MSSFRDESSASTLSWSLPSSYHSLSTIFMVFACQSDTFSSAPATQDSTFASWQCRHFGGISSATEANLTSNAS